MANNNVKKNNRRNKKNVPANKQQPRVKGLNQNKPLPKRRKAPGEPRGETVKSRYAAMVASPLNSVVTECYPDGSQDPSIAYKYKQVLTISPDTDGNIIFMMVPGLQGAIAVRTGNFQISVPRYTGTTNGATNPSPGNFVNGTNPQTAYTLVPYTEVVTSLLGVTDVALKQFLPFTPSRYRVLAQEIRCAFTGSTLADSGSVVTARHNITPALNGVQKTVNGVIYDIYSVASLPGSQGSVSSAPSAQLRAARETLVSKTVNTTPVFHEIHSHSAVTSDSGIGLDMAMLSSTSTLSTAGTTSFDPLMSCVIYSYSGMAATASVTVEVATSIEMGLAVNSPIVGLAHPNPPRDARLDSWLSSAFAYLPSSQQVLNGAMPFVSSAFRQSVRAGMMALGN